jgi:hypothetical protein
MSIRRIPEGSWSTIMRRTVELSRQEYPFQNYSAPDHKTDSTKVQQELFAEGL